MCVSKYGCATVALQFVLIPLHYESLKEFELPKDVVCKNIDAKYNAFTHGHKMRLKSKFDEKMENNGQHSQNRKKTNISWRKERKNKINVCITKISTKFHYFVLLLIVADCCCFTGSIKKKMSHFDDMTTISAKEKLPLHRE